jgi:hypothetical protein
LIKRLHDCFVILINLENNQVVTVTEGLFQRLHAHSPRNNGESFFRLGSGDAQRIGIRQGIQQKDMKSHCPDKDHRLISDLRLPQGL